MLIRGYRPFFSPKFNFPQDCGIIAKEVTGVFLFFGWFAWCPFNKSLKDTRKGVLLKTVFPDWCLFLKGSWKSRRILSHPEFGRKDNNSSERGEMM